MPNARLKAKWKNFFRVFDNDGDKVITISDFALKSNRIITVFKLDDAESVKCTQIILRWWKFCQSIFGEKKDKITEDEFLEVLENIYIKDKKSLETTMTELSSYLFDLTDVDRDGFITTEEWDQMMTCMGIEHSAKNREVFDMWDKDDDGEINREEYNRGMVAYLTSVDPDKDYGFIFNVDNKNLPAKKHQPSK